MGDFVSRMSVAVSIKEAGNQHYKNSEYFDAKYEYERALSLFKWVISSDPNWKSKVMIRIYPSYDRKIRDKWALWLLRESMTQISLKCLCL